MAYAREKDGLKQQRNWRVKNQAAGKCSRCAQPAAPGIKLCAYHRDYAARMCRSSGKDKVRKWAKTTRNNLKEAMFSHYGNICACCGEAHKEFLTVDHINGDGAAHRKSGVKGGSGILRWLKKNGYPSGFRVLCANCNLAMGVYGVCPHGTLPVQHTNHPANPHSTTSTLGWAV